MAWDFRNTKLSRAFSFLDLIDLRCPWPISRCSRRRQALSTISSQKKVSKSVFFLIPVTQGFLRISIDYCLKHVKFQNPPYRSSIFDYKSHSASKLRCQRPPSKVKRLADCRWLAIIRLVENGHVCEGAH